MEWIVYHEFGSWKPARTAQELQLKGASQRGQELLDMEAKDSALLKTPTKHRSEDHDGEH
jgi:hypothetical protein